MGSTLYTDGIYGDGLSLTEEQRRRLIEHMNKEQDDGFALHAFWASTVFGKNITEDYCARLYLDSIIG